jgi:hypothetical protein
VGTTLKRAKRRRHIEYCEQHQEQIFAVGKSPQVEDAPAAGRVADSNQPRRSAGVDLMHTVSALAYCDYFSSP